MLPPAGAPPKPIQSVWKGGGSYEIDGSSVRYRRQPRQKSWGSQCEVHKRLGRYAMNRYVVRFLACAALGAATLGFAGPGWAADVKSETIDAIKKRDQLICGVDTGIPGFAF